MEINTVTYFGWRDSYQTVEKRITYHYPKGNDVTTVETRSYLVTLYNVNVKLIEENKGNNIDLYI